MPTIIALDVSLSMQRNILGRSETYHQLALKGISQLLEYLSLNSKLEFVALLTYSCSAELKVDFTRDYDQVRQVAKKQSESGDKVCIIQMLSGIANIFSSNWGIQNNCQVVVFTDCGIGFGSTSLNNFISRYMGNEKDQDYAGINLLKTSKVKINFVCLGLHSDSYFTRATALYQQLLDFTELKGQLYMTKPLKESIENTDGDLAKNANSSSSASTHSSHKSELGRTAMFDLTERICENNFKPYEAVLKCGGYFRMECPIIIWPPPIPHQSKDDNNLMITIAPKLEICGYLSLSEIGSPASLSRHLVMSKVDREKPTRRTSDKTSNSTKSSNSGNANAKPTLDVSQPNYEYEKLELDIREFYTKDVKDGDDSGDDVEGNTNKSSSSTSGPTEAQKESMCVLLHGALKVENLAALVLLGENWFGFLYTYADSKKKSNLLLNILPPGSNVIPWLGDLQMLGFAEDLMPGESSAFPVKAEKRSYSQNCVVWIRHASLQSDVQKVLRHAKKIPEKTQHFYKELNRIRRAALSIGFVELLEAMATLFEKECTHLAIGAHPECTLQLRHAAVELRKPSNRDLKASIVPIQKFSSGAEVAGPSASGFVY